VKTIFNAAHFPQHFPQRIHSGSDAALRGSAKFMGQNFAHSSQLVQELSVNFN
jgi:hypothetical protein